jgi:hypothetical protein
MTGIDSPDRRLAISPPFQVFAGAVVSMLVLIFTDAFLLVYVSRCPGLSPYLVLGTSMLPNLAIGSVAILRRARAFGLAVIVGGVLSAIVGTGFVAGLSACFPVA